MTITYPHPVEEFHSWSMSWQDDPEWEADPLDWQGPDEAPFRGKTLAHLMGCKACWHLYEGEIEQIRWTAREAARGRLAFCPETMNCYECGWAAKDAGKDYTLDDIGMPFIERHVTDLGRIIESRRDPTQTYELECGHSAF